MRAVDVKPVHLAVAAGVVVLAYVALRGVRGAAQGITSGAVNAVGGVVEGLGLGLGLPVTDKEKCQKAIASGSIFDRSIYCTSGEFAANMWDGFTSLPVDVPQVIGDMVGLPRTDGARCEAAKRAGDTLGASRYCGAGDFLKWWWEK